MAFHTVSDKDEGIRRSKKAGFDFHLSKSVDFRELRSVLAQVSAQYGGRANQAEAGICRSSLHFLT